MNGNNNQLLFRGRLYRGERNSEFGRGNFMFGDGLYLTSHYGDASSYAVINSFINRDLSGNISNLSKIMDISYNEAKMEIEKNGDGVVDTFKVSYDRIIEFGKGGLFPTDHIKAPAFNQRLSLALAECDVSAEVRDRLVRFTAKHNEDPTKLLSMFKTNGASGVLAKYASICNYEVFKINESITPSDSIYKGLGIQHYVVLNEKHAEFLRSDSPITIDPCIYFPNFKGDKTNEVFSHVCDCESKMTKILEDFSNQPELSEITSTPARRNKLSA